MRATSDFEPSRFKPGTVALDLTCAECGLASSRRDVADGVIDVVEAAMYRPECAEREFGEADYPP